MIYLAFILLFFGILLLWQANSRQKSIGLPAGRVIYSDTKNWGAVEQALYDQELGLTGKPDYLIEKRGDVIPVEVKSSRISGAPYDSHIFQLATYCLLVERTTGKRPPYGILHYPNRTFAIDYTDQLENTLFDLLEEIRSQERRKEPDRSHESSTRCNACGFKNICDHRLI